MIGGIVEREIIILSLTTFFLFIYCLYIHLQLQRFKRDFKNLNILNGKMETLVMKIELDLTKEEFFEVLDATHKEHWDWKKRALRTKVYMKLKEVYDNLE